MQLLPFPLNRRFIQLFPFHRSFSVASRRAWHHKEMLRYCTLCVRLTVKSQGVCDQVSSICPLTAITSSRIVGSQGCTRASSRLLGPSSATNLLRYLQEDYIQDSSPSRELIPSQQGIISDCLVPMVTLELDCSNRLHALIGV